MTLLLALRLVAQTPVTEPPPGLLFGFYRIIAFQSRAKDLGCEAGDLDRQFELTRKQLVARYGKKPFSPPKPPSSGGPGDCQMVTMVYRANLATFQKDAAAALAAPAQAQE